MTEHDSPTLVSADWVEEHLEDFQSDDPEYRLLEVNNPTVTADSEYTPYEEGHIPGAIFFDWDDDLSDETTRDILDKDAFEELNAEAGITEESTIVLYGGGRVPNWFALFAYWQYRYFGHDDVRIIDGGKPYWVENDYPLTADEQAFAAQEYEASGPYESIRAYKSDVEQAIDSGIPLVDVRSPEEFTGEVIAPEGLQETAQRGGHIPGAKSVPTTSVLDDDGTFKGPDELRELYEDVGITEDQSVITYCRVGERSSIEWYVLAELLGFDDVQNYDGSWTEWGNTIRAPIETGDAE
ncbi:rhodanese domain protein [Natronomonas pharaonis DSM 2160]|uniref:Sulfurtransferase n=1 Tax=Natronomonas pharaonis (strain ATCC 35678 / DSM 2160 / CIP 103997 / JCM 8858 / NBRC 14720 / NCIMB 2260 / Gabara) TaxID=348780 RepID=A0A1U7EX44_NATPD|nr:sulfurtransferase [Natronomonas pharaonis]CAI49684.1 rhodanese domain protein [Natronomonas pharaonis DSM 2160]